MPGCKPWHRPKGGRRRSEPRRGGAGALTLAAGGRQVPHSRPQPRQPGLAADRPRAHTRTRTRARTHTYTHTHTHTNTHTQACARTCTCAHAHTHTRTHTHIHTHTHTHTHTPSPSAFNTCDFEHMPTTTRRGNPTPTRRHRTRLDDGHEYALRLQLKPQGVREGLQGALGGRVSRVHGQGDAAGLRGRAGASEVVCLKSESGRTPPFSAACYQRAGWREVAPARIQSKTALALVSAPVHTKTGMRRFF
jgi:hypothetical protein